MKTKFSIANAAEEILSRSGQPMHYKEITSLILNQCDLKGKTPALSVRSCLARDPKFKRTSEGFYALSKWKKYPAVKFAKDIAFEILEKGGEPMDALTLGTGVSKVRKFKGDPKSIVRSFLFTDKRFYYYRSTGMIGLTKWKKSVP
jgi:hypothetical protein